MKIDFSTHTVDFNDGYPPILLEAPITSAGYWGRALKKLRRESSVNDIAFEGWLKEEWNIKLLKIRSEFVNNISGVELDEPTLTLLLLKFPV